MLNLKFLGIVFIVFFSVHLDDYFLLFDLLITYEHIIF